MTFKTMAAEEKWRILSAQNFYATPNASDVNATEQLRNIKGTGQTQSGSILPPACLVCGKVLLSVAYVCLFTGDPHLTMTHYTGNSPLHHPQPWLLHHTVTSRRLGPSTFTSPYRVFPSSGYVQTRSLWSADCGQEGDLLFSKFIVNFANKTKFSIINKWIHFFGLR